MTEVFMPKNGMDMHEGKLIKWLKEVGDHVEMDEPIMEIETDKITMEAESPGTGILLAKLANDGDVIPVLQVIGYVGEKGEKVPQAAAPAAGPTTPAAAATSAPAPSEVLMSIPPEAAPATLSGNGIAATPYAKKLAAENGVALAGIAATGKHGEILAGDVIAKVNATPLAQRIATDKGVNIAGVAGTGFNGKVTKDDVLSAIGTPLNAAPAASGDMAVESRQKIAGMRKVIAERMFASHSQIPVVTQNVVADVTALLALRETINTGKEKANKISINDFVLKACSIAVSESPLVRTSLEGDELVQKADTNIGFAVGTEGSLIVPVIRNADRLSLSKLAAQAKDLANRARNGGLKPTEYSGSTFTITNMGMFQVDSFTPIINQPDSAILGVNRVRDELALVDGEVVVKKVMTLSLTFDHRILDGVTAAKFELRIKELMENPMEILV